jgi:hypothetical protein
VLHPLRDGKPTHLQTIYIAIAEGLKEGGYVNPKLFTVDGRWGDRPDYTNVVRSTMSSQKHRGLVEKRGKGRTGAYRITDRGKATLSQIEP